MFCEDCVGSPVEVEVVDSVFVGAGFILAVGVIVTWVDRDGNEGAQLERNRSALISVKESQERCTRFVLLESPGQVFCCKLIHYSLAECRGSAHPGGEHINRDLH